MQTSVNHPAVMRQALLFFAGLENPAPPASFTFLIRLAISVSFLFTVFRFSHGVAVIYDIEKKTTETSATPSSKRIELVFAFLLLEVAALFLMSTTLAKLDLFVYSTMALVACDLV